jgi:hypothetical protein
VFPKIYFKDYLGISYEEATHMTRANWLSMPQQKLLAITSGKVFYDGLGTIVRYCVLRVYWLGVLGKVRAALEYYPNDVWLYILLCQYDKILQEAAFVGRTALLGTINAFLVYCLYFF